MNQHYEEENGEFFSFLEKCSTVLTDYIPPQILKEERSLPKKEKLPLPETVVARKDFFEKPSQMDPSYFEGIVESLSGSMFRISKTAIFEQNSLFQFLTSIATPDESTIRRTYRKSYITQEEIDTCKPGSSFTFGTEGGGCATWYFYRALNGEAYYIISSGTTYQVDKTSGRLQNELR